MPKRAHRSQSKRPTLSVSAKLYQKLRAHSDEHQISISSLIAKIAAGLPDPEDPENR